LLRLGMRRHRTQGKGEGEGESCRQPREKSKHWSSL
jgi:hypothetical protein